MPDLLTIVITTYNRKPAVKKLLQHLEGQSDSRFEVVVAIDGSTDGTHNMLTSVHTSFPLRWLDTGFKGYGLAKARNLGILAANGDVVVILDDDSFPQPNFVKAHLAANKPKVMTCGPRKPVDPENTSLHRKMARLSEIKPLVDLSITELLKKHPTISLVENNISMSRQDWISLGLFSERLKLYGFIGQEFFARAKYIDARWQFAPLAEIVHHSEMEGDNGLDRVYKTRQLRLAQILRPSLMQPRQYRKQIEWAKAHSENQNIPSLPYPFHAWLLAPVHFAKRGLIIVKRRLTRI